MMKSNTIDSTDSSSECSTTLTLKSIKEGAFSDSSSESSSRFKSYFGTGSTETEIDTDSEVSTNKTRKPYPDITPKCK